MFDEQTPAIFGKLGADSYCWFVPWHTGPSSIGDVWAAASSLCPVGDEIKTPAAASVASTDAVSVTGP